MYSLGGMPFEEFQQILQEQVKEEPEETPAESLLEVEVSTEPASTSVGEETEKGSLFLILE